MWPGARRIVVAPPDGDLTNNDIAPVEALIDRLEDGSPRMSVRCVLEDGDLAKLATGGHVWISFLAPQLIPFALTVTGPDGQ